MNSGNFAILLKPLFANVNLGMTVANVPYFTLNNGRIFHQSELGENSCTSYIVLVMLIESLAYREKVLAWSSRRWCRCGQDSIEGEAFLFSRSTRPH